MIPLLLNALDGVAATEGGGRIIFMTTNHIEKLPEVLIRPGRIDVKEYIGLASSQQVRKMFLKFFPDKFDMAEKFCQKVPPLTTSMAQLQAFLIVYKSSPEQALNEISAFVNSLKEGFTTEKLTGQNIQTSVKQ